MTIDPISPARLPSLTPVWQKAPKDILDHRLHQSPGRAERPEAREDYPPNHHTIRAPHREDADFRFAPAAALGEIFEKLSEAD